MIVITYPTSALIFSFVAASSNIGSDRNVVATIDPASSEYAIRMTREISVCGRSTALSVPMFVQPVWKA